MNRRRRMIFLVATLVVCAALAVISLRRFEYRQVYYPSRTLEASPTALGRPCRDVFIPVEHGESINAWYFPMTKGRQESHGPVYLVCHGNAGNIGDRLALAGSLLGTGAGVLLFDYRGYGRSDGAPGEENTYRDAQAAYRWLRAGGVAASGIIVYGESLGGGVASELALREKIGGLILHSTFTSIPDIGAELFPYLPVRLMGRIKYDTRSKLPRIHVPVLVVHSTNDDLVAFHHGERNFAAAHEPKFFCRTSGSHGEALDGGEPAEIAALRQFVELVAKRAEMSPHGD